MADDNNSNGIKIQLPDNYQPPDWSIGELYSQAWSIVKKYKVLWIFGIAVSTFASGSSLRNMGNWGSSSSSSNPSSTPLPSQLNDKPISSLPDITHVLGSTTTAKPWDFLSNFFPHISGYIWAILGIEVLAFIVLSIVVGIILNAWSTGALLSAVNDALSGKIPSIRSSSERSISRLKSMAWVNVVPIFLASITLIIVALGLMAGVILGSAVIKSIFIIIGIPVFIISIIAIIYINLITIWAQRNVIETENSGKIAFSQGRKIASQKKGAMLLLGLVNNILGGIVFGVPILILILIGLGAVIGGVSIHPNFSNGITAVLIGLGVLLIFAVIVAFQIGGGVFTAFKAVVWSLAYHKVKDKYLKD